MKIKNSFLFFWLRANVSFEAGEKRSILFMSTHKLTLRNQEAANGRLLFSGLTHAYRFVKSLVASS